MDQTVLLASDSSVEILQLLTELDKDYQYVVAIDATKAIAEMEKQIPRLIIINWQVASIMAIELMEEIRKRNQDIPILYVTSAEGNNIELAMEAGATDCVEAPIRKAIFLMRVKHLLQFSYYQQLEHDYREKIEAETKAFLEQVTELSPAVVYLMDAQTNVNLYGNKQTWELLEYTEEEAQTLGEAFLPSILHPDDLNIVLAHLEARALYKDGYIGEVVYRVKDAKGNWRWLLSREVVFKRHTDGRAAEILGTAQDITTLKNYEKKLIKINESKDRVLATVAHDLHNPIQNVKGILYLLRLEAEKLDDDYKHMLTLVDADCNKAIHLISELLEIAELENDGYELPRTSREINYVIKQILEPFERKAIEKKLTLEYSPTKDEIYVQINEKKFFRVIENLLVNAIKFTPKEGSISVKVNAFQEKVRIQLQDTGIGIPTELQPIVFDKFSKASRLGLNKEKSTGLGMSIVKQIVELHRGTIWFKSIENQGTTFFIELPLN